MWAGLKYLQELQIITEMGTNSTHIVLELNRVVIWIHCLVEDWTAHFAVHLKIFFKDYGSNIVIVAWVFRCKKKCVELKAEFTGIEIDLLYNIVYTDIKYKPIVTE